MDTRLRRAAEEALASAWNGAVRLAPDESTGIDGNAHVRRFQVQSAPATAPSTVVVKRPRLADAETFDPRSDGSETTKFFTEWACLQLLDETGSDAAPHLYGGDAERGFVVMEDLGSGQRLDHALLGDDPLHARARASPTSSGDSGEPRPRPMMPGRRAARPRSRTRSRLCRFIPREASSTR